MNRLMSAVLASLALLVAAPAAQANPGAALSARASDPVSMGWMRGFPPSQDKQIRFTDPDYFAFPRLRWTVCNFRGLMPTAGVRSGAGGPSALPRQIDPSLDAVRFTPLGGGASMTWGDAFDANYSDGVLVLHHGRIVYERYAGCLNQTTLHGAMSVTKSLTGLMGEILVAEGRLDPTALVGTLIPELKTSAFGDATVRQVMDMTTGLAYSEDYADPKADVWLFGEAGSPLPKPPGYTGPRSYYDYLQTVKAQGRHGEAFGYKTINADALGWLIARTTGQSVAEHLAEAIWSRIGTEREAFYTVDSIGTPFAGGGFNATLRDLGRLGLLVLNEGRWNGEPVLPAAAIASIRQGGDRAVFAKAGFGLLPGWSYRAMWWVCHDDHGAFAARGVHGQTIWIDPKAQMVIVRFASNPVAGNAASDPTSLPAYRAVAEHLMAHDKPMLAGQEWAVEQLAGAGVIDNSQPSLQFFPDGRLAGNASCNRLIASYALDGQQLRIAPAGATMMACPPALMQQERKLLDLLPGISAYRIDDSGALLLLGADGKVLVIARR